MLRAPPSSLAGIPAWPITYRRPPCLPRSQKREKKPRPPENGIPKKRCIFYRHVSSYIVGETEAPLTDASLRNTREKTVCTQQLLLQEMRHHRLKPATRDSRPTIRNRSSRSPPPDSTSSRAYPEMYILPYIWILWGGIQLHLMGAPWKTHGRPTGYLRPARGHGRTAEPATAAVVGKAILGRIFEPIQKALASTAVGV